MIPTRHSVTLAVTVSGGVATIDADYDFALMLTRAHTSLDQAKDRWHERRQRREGETLMASLGKMLSADGNKTSAVTAPGLRQSR